MNINYKEMMETKTFLANPKHQYRESQREKHDCSANNKRKEDYYRDMSLSHSMNEH